MNAVDKVSFINVPSRKSRLRSGELIIEEIDYRNVIALGDYRHYININNVLAGIFSIYRKLTCVLRH